MNAERLEQIKERAEKAVAGPWTVENPMDSPAVIANGHKQAYDWDFIAHIETGKAKHSVKADRNASFIAHARQDIPDLLAEIERLTTRITALETENERLLEALKFYCDDHQKNPNLGPWGVNSTDFGNTAHRALQAKP